MKKQPIKCERCGETLIPGKVVWLELSNTDGKYYRIKDLAERSIPEGHVSQGGFPFGSDCAKKQLKETENEIEGKKIKPDYVKTHIVIDMVYHEDEGNEVFVGTKQECEDWQSAQGFGYKVVPMTPTEIKMHNERKI
jgi:hypothetical protein